MSEDYSRTGPMAWVYDVFSDMSDEEIVKMLKEWDATTKELFKSTKKGARKLP